MAAIETGPQQAQPLTTTDHRLACYHCGEQMPTGVSLAVEIGGLRRAMCCPGCCAVATLIAGSGMDSFYQQRTAYSTRPDTADTGLHDSYLVYDQPGTCDGFTTVNENGPTEARLLLGGMTCAACSWLIEQTLGRITGVESATVHLQQCRLDLRFDSEQVKLSALFARVEALGYRARPFLNSVARQQFARQYKSDLRRLAVAGIGMMQVGMFAVALHAGDIQGIAAEYQQLLRWVSLAVASFVVLFSARPFFHSAWRHLRQGALVMDLPVALAIGLALVASFWATITDSGQVYFDSVVMFTFFLLLGRFLEQRARQSHTLNWFDAQSLLPDSATRFSCGGWCTVSRRELEIDDRILIKLGDTIPVDAEVLVGSSAVKEDTFNGEHLPRPVERGSVIYAGTVNLEDSLEARVLGKYQDSRLAALQRSVDLAQTEKPRLAQIADRVASWFVAGVLLVTAFTAAVWSQLQPDQALWISLSVLVISCPCALALATPAALANAAGALRRTGVIVRGENALEALSHITHLIFDKTGTLTEGELTIARVVPLAHYSETQLLAVASALQQHSHHPAARAFADIDAAADFQRVKYVIGAGLEGYRDNACYRIGSETYCRQLTHSLPTPPDQDYYWIALCSDDVALAWIGLTDQTRTEAAQVVEQARMGGLEIELLTGDSSSQGPILADSLGITNVSTGLLPEHKIARVRALQAGGAVVAMVGDGLNDAPVLGMADASFAVAGATALARTQADFIIVDGDLQQVIDSWHKARKCRRIILQNLCWALAYNLSAIPLAAMGLVPPWAAAIGMSLSSLLVVLNSLRLNNQVRN